MKRSHHSERRALPSSKVALWSVIGVLLVVALFGGGWLYLSHQKQKAEEEAYYAEQQVLRERHEKSLGEHREKEKQEQLERKQKEENERLAIIRESGLSPFQITARELYREMWNRDWETAKMTTIMKEWYPLVDALRNSEVATAELKQLSLDPFEIYHLGSYLAEEKKLADEIAKEDFVGFTPKQLAESETELRKEYEQRKSLNDSIVEKWDSAFALSRGKAKNEEQEKLFLAQAKAAKKDALSLSGTPADSTDLGNTGDVTGAWSYMQLFVEKKLKNPSGAKFPFGGHRDVVNLGEDRYRVQSYVDSTNAFGATIRTNFVGVVKQRHGGWDLESLIFE